LKLAYISGPYRAPTIRGIVENIRRAEAVALKYWKLGYAVICPHLNTRLFDGALPDYYWLSGDMEILSRCDVIVMCERWQLSVGATREKELAQKLGKEIIYE
jgi:hypothetical protein